MYLQKKSLGLETHGLATELYLTLSTLWIDSRLLCSWDFPGKNTGVHCHFLLQGIIPTQGSNQCLLHCRWILCQLSHQGRPMMHGQWQRCKIRTTGRAEARMKHHGNEDTKVVWGENSTSAPSRLQGPQGVLQQVWQPGDQPPLWSPPALTLGTQISLLAGEESHKLIFTLSISSLKRDVKDKIFLTQGATSWGYPGKQRRYIKGSRTQQAGPTIRQSGGKKNSRVTQWISRDLFLKTFCR